MSPANFQPVAHIPTWQEIEHASQVIRDAVHVTPMLHSRTFGTMTGANVYLKSENLQRTGSFKVRGATYKIAQLSEEERRRGVIATSMGNHAQAVAVAPRVAQPGRQRGRGAPLGWEHRHEPAWELHRPWIAEPRTHRHRAYGD